MLENNKKSVLFNCSTNVVGGGVKNSAIFIKSVFSNNDVNWIFAISPQVKQLLIKMGLVLDSRFEEFEKSPSKNLDSRKRL